MVLSAILFLQSFPLNSWRSYQRSKDFYRFDQGIELFSVFLGPPVPYRAFSYWLLSSQNLKVRMLLKLKWKKIICWVLGTYSLVGLLFVKVSSTVNQQTKNIFKINIKNSTAMCKMHYRIVNVTKERRHFIISLLLNKNVIKFLTIQYHHCFRPQLLAW